MKVLFVFCFTALSIRAAGLSHTNGMTVSSGTDRGTYQWRLSADRMLATPEWIPEKQAIPLPPDKAARLGGDWLSKNSFFQYTLQSIEVLRYPSPYVGDPGPQLRKRFYYRLKYDAPEHPSVMPSMYVYVLLDGSVLEPTLTPSKAKAK
jgi:hypothetical protein